MAENSRMTGKYRMLTTNRNVPVVDKNLYVKSLRNRNIPYDIRQRQFGNLNSKTQKPDVPPRCSSLITNHKITTADISAQLSGRRNKFPTLDNAFRQRSTPTSIVRPNQINLSCEYVDTYKM